MSWIQNTAHEFIPSGRRPKNRVRLLPYDLHFFFCSPIVFATPHVAASESGLLEVLFVKKNVFVTRDVPYLFGNIVVRYLPAF